MRVPRIVTLTPFDATGEKNLGRAYNEDVELVPEDAWVVLLDHDVHLLTLTWHAQIREAIAAVPEAGVFTCVTNRIGAPWQQVGPPDSHDLATHHKIAHTRARLRSLLDITDTKGFGGCQMAFSTRAWRQVGGFRDGFFCVDHRFHFDLVDAGYRNYCIEGLYLYHRRRAFGVGVTGTLPLPPRADCRCGGAQPAPTVRILLPERAA